MLTVNPAEMLYVTPRVVETAMSAGVIAFGGSKNHMNGIYELIAQNIPECMPPHTGRDNFIFVARWAGRFGVGRDIDLAYTGPDEPYLHASDYADYVPARGRTEANGWTTKGALEADKNKTLIDIAFGNWNRPTFGWRVAEALTPRPPITNDHDRMVAHAGLGYVDRRRSVRIQADIQYEHPFSILRPPGKPYKKAPLGSDWIK